MAAAAQPAAAVDYADGGTHIIDTPVLADSRIFDGPGGTPTTVHVVAGGAFGTLNVYGSSRVNFFAGSTLTNTLNVRNSASAYIVDGSIEHLDTLDISTAYVTGGSFTDPSVAGPRVRAFGGTTIYVSGGAFQNTANGASGISATSGGILRVCGGVLLPNTAGERSIGASGGGPNSTVRISGGAFDRLAIGGNSDVGIVLGTGFVARNSDGSVALVGYGTLPAGFNGTVTGTYADGGALDFAVSVPLFATVTLAPPDPLNCAIPAPPENPTQAAVDVPLPLWALALLGALFAAVSRQRLRA